MTLRLTRIAGALLLFGDGTYTLIGNTKEPCSWEEVGFRAPTEFGSDRLYIRILETLDKEPKPASHALTVTLAGATAQEIAALLEKRLLIRRNGSVSERLWRILTGTSDESDTPIYTDISWLVMMPETTWDIVRDAALRCL